jgi:outer membrane protein OmpA-like peptidoglycan-associated protein
MKKCIIAVLITLAFAAHAQEKAVVLFDFDKSVLTNNAVLSLDSLLKLPSFFANRIALFGHTDSVGNLAYNDRLSVRRVDAVQDYLVSHGFPKENITAEKGWGKRRPLNENADEAQRQANRRVEIILPTTAKDNRPVPERSLTEKFTDTATHTGTRIILHNLNFYGGRHFLLPQSEPVLLELMNALRANPGIEIAIHGHICCANGAEDGLDIDTNTFDLSVNRAKEIYDYLVDNGIAAARLSYKGFGHMHPLVYPEDTEQKRTTNRRVEIRIVKK